MDKFTYPNRSVPCWIVWVQCVCFTVLYAIWAVPETILIRHICLIVGALLSIYVITQKFGMLLTKKALPIWMLCLLFLWTFFHLLALGTESKLQFEEFTGVWKRTAIGFIFAVGFGLALADHMQGHKQEDRQSEAFWRLIYFGFMLPTIIYLGKYILTIEAHKFGIVVPDYLKLHYGSLPFYMPKTVYVAFCLPLFAITLSQVALEMNRQRWRPLIMIAYIFSFAAVLFVFYAENIKNGIAHTILITVIFCVVLLLKCRVRIRARLVIFILVLVLALGFLAIKHIKNNESWSTLFADMRVAAQVDRYEHWKYSGHWGYPNNEFGKEVSATNYERIAWAVTGLELLIKNPLGFGLIERSFGNLAKQQWPESKLHQSHSGWLDLALGLGLPGIALVLGALVFILLRCVKSFDPLTHFGFWLLLSLVLLWCTTEVSQKVYFDWLIFAIAWVGAITLSEA